VILDCSDAIWADDFDDHFLLAKAVTAIANIAEYLPGSFASGADD
jgi:hypothetical protein